MPSLKTWKETWEEWDVRGFMILSLTLQMLLILLAPLRKRSSRSWITMPIWLAYLLADWAANFAVGLISRTQAYYSRMPSGNGNNSSKPQNHLLLAYWAPFLLVHLGGPDTITAFALEDNELWLRHLLGLVFQSFAALYVLSQSWETNKLLIPAAGLMFISGLIKYSERTRSLFLASLSRFRDSMVRDPDPGPNYAKLMDEYYSKKEARLPTRIQLIGEPDRGAKSTNKVKHGRLVDSEVVLYAQQFFQTFRGLIVGTIFSFRERNQSRDFFLARTAEDAFGVVEVELNFIYEALYTKVNLVCNKLGFFSRVISFSCVIASFVIFYSQPKKRFDRFDVGVTYTLLFGAIGLDCIAFVMLIQSDWFLAYTKKLPEAAVIFEVQNQNQPKYVIAVEEEAVEPVKCQIRRFFSRRWSESLSTYNLIHYCTNPRPEVKEKFIGYLGLKKLLDVMKYVNAEPFTEELRDHIFAEIWKKSELADNLEIAKEINEARGDWVLRVEGCDELLKHTVEVDYDESIILWHLATELCYNDEISHGNDCKNNKFRNLSKILSDYMMYLLIMQPTMMSTVIGIGEIRYRDTCAEARRFLRSKNLLIDRNRNPNFFQVILYAIRSFFKYTGLFFYGSLLFFLALILSTPMAFIYVLDKGFFCNGKLLKPLLKKAHNFHSRVLSFFGKGKENADEQEMIIISACKRILAVNTEVKPVTVKGDRSKSVLFDGCILAKELQEMGRSEGKNNRKWEIVSKVWVELLCYAASHCTANAHAQQLTKGGELITIVWLLMAHFGLGDQFQISKGHARAKLIVGK